MNVNDKNVEITTKKEKIDEASRIWQLSSFDVSEQIGHYLNGDLFIEPTNKWTENTDINKRLMNENGIRMTKTIVSGKINKNILLSYYEPEEIRNIMLDFEKSMIDKISMDWKEMGINKSNATQILLIVCDNVEASFRRARFGGEKQFIENTEERRIITTENNNRNNDKNILSGIPFLGGGRR